MVLVKDCVEESLKCLNQETLTQGNYEQLDVAKAKVSLNLCITDLEAYKNEQVLYKTHVEEYFETVVQHEQDGHYYCKEHRLLNTNANLKALRSSFVNKRIENIKSRFPEKSLLDFFYVLSMRTINFENLNTYGNEEILKLVSFYGEKQYHKGSTSDLILDKDTVLRQRLKLLLRRLDTLLTTWRLCGAC
uniref:Uncharacterized protein n=1 Tax=Magallana gigas TaxID=29159 RepID=A0A8W8NTX4_MAGGI